MLAAPMAASAPGPSGEDPPETHETPPNQSATEKHPVTTAALSVKLPAAAPSTGNALAATVLRRKSLATPLPTPPATWRKARAADLAV
jgi:hypothetical protein